MGNLLPVCMIDFIEIFILLWIQLNEKFKNVILKNPFENTIRIIIQFKFC